jgi:hypothetical protein
MIGLTGSEKEDLERSPRRQGAKILKERQRAERDRRACQRGVLGDAQRYFCPSFRGVLASWRSLFVPE